jgi:hypothetical protein
MRKYVQEIVQPASNVSANSPAPAFGIGAKEFGIRQ